MRKKRVRDRERKWEEEGERERERGSPTQLPGEKTALLLTQDSLCLTTLPSSPSLSPWHTHTLKLTCLFSNTKTPCFLMCTWSFFVKATPLISLSLCCFSTPYPQCVCVCVSLLLLLPKNILYWTPQFLVMKTDKGLHCNKSTVVSFAFSCSTNSGSQSGPELLAISFFSNSGTFQMLAGQWLVANLPAHAQVYAPQW